MKLKTAFLAAAVSLCCVSGFGVERVGVVFKKSGRTVSVKNVDLVRVADGARVEFFFYVARAVLCVAVGCPVFCCVLRWEAAGVKLKLRNAGN